MDPPRATVRYKAGNAGGVFKLKLDELTRPPGGKAGEDGFEFVPKVVR